MLLGRCCEGLVTLHDGKAAVQTAVPDSSDQTLGALATIVRNPKP